jgi:hypothetical protein
MKTIAMILFLVFTTAFSFSQGNFGDVLETCMEFVAMEEEADYVFWKLELDLISSSEETEMSKFEVIGGTEYTFMAFSPEEEIYKIRIELRDADGNLLVTQAKDRSKNEAGISISVLDYAPTTDQTVWTYIYADQFAEGELQGHYALMVLTEVVNSLSYEMFKYDEYEYNTRKGEYKYLSTEYESSTFEVNVTDKAIYHYIGYSKYKYNITNVESDEDLVTMDVTDDYSGSFYFIFDLNNSMIKVLNNNTLILKVYSIKE